MLPKTPESAVPKQQRHPSDIPTLARVLVAELLMGHARPQAEPGAVSTGLLFLYINARFLVGDEPLVILLVCNVSSTWIRVTHQTRWDLLLYRLFPTFLALETLMSLNVSF